MKGASVNVWPVCTSNKSGGLSRESVSDCRVWIEFLAIAPAVLSHAAQRLTKDAFELCVKLSPTCLCMPENVIIRLIVGLRSSYA